MTKKRDGYFYSLKTLYDISRRNDIKIVLGDFSAQVRWRKIVGEM